MPTGLPGPVTVNYNRIYGAINIFSSAAAFFIDAFASASLISAIFAFILSVQSVEECSTVAHLEHISWPRHELCECPNLRYSKQRRGFGMYGRNLQLRTPSRHHLELQDRRDYTPADRAARIRCINTSTNSIKQSSDVHPNIKYGKQLTSNAVGIEFLIMDDIACPFGNEVSDVLQSGNTIRMQWPAYSLGKNPIE
ncbi:hypothetical protein TNCV_838671 [Trichonephila clavipes]|nr:hypothetical protein TNCV_838671 [Trichonephila clavipes]